MGPNPLDFDAMVDLLRIRIADADAINSSEVHSFRKLMADYADGLPDQWYWHALEDLEAQGHLDRASHKGAGGDAFGRVSAEGRWYLRASDAD